MKCLAAYCCFYGLVFSSGLLGVFLNFCNNFFRGVSAYSWLQFDFKSDKIDGLEYKNDSC